MEVDGKKYYQLGWEEEYCRYYNIGIIVYCNVNLRQAKAELIDIRWIDESQDPFTEDDPSKKVLSRFVKEKVLLAITDNYGFNRLPDYNYYTADLDLSITRLKEDTDIYSDNLIIQNFIVNTYGCVRPDKTMTLHLSGRNILPDKLLKDSNIEGSPSLNYEFRAPKSVPIKEYYYDEGVNEFIRFDPNYNTKDKTVLMVDMDPLTLELLQKLDSKGKKLLNIKLSNMVSELIEEVNYLMNPEETDQNEEE